MEIILLVKDAIPLTGGCQNPVEIVEFKNTTWDILRSISENMDKLFRPVGEHYGLTMMQVRILLEIGNRTRTVGSLGKSISVAGGNISAMCKKLEKEGFVMRSRDSADERIVNVTLSEKGKKTIKMIEKDLQRLYAESLAQVDQEDLRNMIMGLEKFNQMVQKMLSTRS